MLPSRGNEKPDPTAGAELRQSLLHIQILSHNIEITGTPGESLLDILQRAGLPLRADCGGQGTCGRCVVQVVSRQCQSSDSAWTSPEMREKGLVLACLSSVQSDLVINIPETAAEPEAIQCAPAAVGEVGTSALQNLSPLSQKLVLQTGPVANDHLSDLERLSRCVETAGELQYSLSALKTLPQAIREKQGLVTATFAGDGPSRKVMKLESGDHTARHFGIACDVGTTTVALQLVDLNTGRVMDTMADYNGQVDCGADVISRILYARKPERREELRRRVLQTINGLLEASLHRHQILPDEVTSAVFAGNTTMTHLLLGIDPVHIREEPYVPGFKTVPLLCAGELNLCICPDAPILCAPNVGSYVGGDITAGVLYALVRHQTAGVTLFIDIGTNGEMVLMGEDWMISCACSAGPSFEGVGISCGMRATSGAIQSVKLLEDGKKIAYDVIGEGKPKGICGSGLLELLAGLFRHGIIGRDGRFNDALGNSLLRLNQKPHAFIVADANETGTGHPVCLTERDITNLMRAKAAIYSGCSLFLKKVGLAYTDITRVYIAGGFGCHLDVEKAITIGLFPDLEPGRFEYLGNTALQGARLALLSREHRRQLLELAGKMTYLDLSGEPDYLPEYSAAMFLPHTDLSLFPSLGKRGPKG